MTFAYCGYLDKRKQSYANMSYKLLMCLVDPQRARHLRTSVNVQFVISLVAAVLAQLPVAEGQRGPVIVEQLHRLNAA